MFSLLLLYTRKIVLINEFTKKFLPATRHVVHIGLIKTAENFLSFFFCINSKCAAQRKTQQRANNFFQTSTYKFDYASFHLINIALPFSPLSRVIYVYTLRFMYTYTNRSFFDKLITRSLFSRTHKLRKMVEYSSRAKLNYAISRL